LETILVRIAKTAKEQPDERFTSLAHLLNEEMLTMCHRELEKNKACGVDRVTKEEYGKNLERNIADLIARMKRKAYRPLPVRRTYIPKPGSDKKRPLGIPCHEDKIVQAGLVRILTPIYEADFLDCSYGYRPGRSGHDALRLLNRLIEEKQVNYIVDADIKGFFDHVDHDILIELVKKRIADTSIIRIIQRILIAGYMEQGKSHCTEEGTPQGGVISPLLANIYLHYALDRWFEREVKEQCGGEAHMVRYADDFVCCFQYLDDARWFLRTLVKRLSSFKLELAEDKTKIVELKRSPDKDRNDKNGGNTSGTFDFLGFTHYSGKSRHGKFRVKRKTSNKKYRAALLRMKEWIKASRNKPIMIIVAELKEKLTGHYRYYGITDNSKSMGNYLDGVKKLVFKWLNRRSQRRSFSWNEFARKMKSWNLPMPRIYHSIYASRSAQGCSK
jgi:group II intron reverse transcriptase/maturase